MQQSLPWAPMGDYTSVHRGTVYEHQYILPDCSRQSTRQHSSRIKIFNEKNPSETSSNAITCSELEAVVCSEAAPQSFQARKLDMTYSNFSSDNEIVCDQLINQEKTPSITTGTPSSVSLDLSTFVEGFFNKICLLEAFEPLYVSSHSINKPKTEKRAELSNSECDDSEGYQSEDDLITSGLSDNKDLTVISSSKVEGLSKFLSIERLFSTESGYGGKSISEDNILIEDHQRTMASSSSSYDSDAGEELNSDDHSKDQGKMSLIEDDRRSLASSSSSKDSAFSDKDLNLQEHPVYGSLDNKTTMNKDQGFTSDFSFSTHSGYGGESISEDSILIEDDQRTMASSSSSNDSDAGEELNSDDDHSKDQGKMSLIEDDRRSLASSSSSNDSGFAEEENSEDDHSKDWENISFMCYLLSKGEKSSSGNSSSSESDEYLRSSVSSSCSIDSGLGDEEEEYSSDTKISMDEDLMYTVSSSSSIDFRNVENDDRVKYWNEFQAVMSETILKKPKTKSVKKKRKQLAAQPVVVPCSKIFQNSKLSKSSAGANALTARKSSVSITSQQTPTSNARLGARSCSLTCSSDCGINVEAGSPVLLSLTPPLHWTKEKSKTCEITRERTYVPKRLFAADMFAMLAV